MSRQPSPEAFVLRVDNLPPPLPTARTGPTAGRQHAYWLEQEIESKMAAYGPKQVLVACDPASLDAVGFAFVIFDALEPLQRALRDLKFVKVGNCLVALQRLRRAPRALLERLGSAGALQQRPATPSSGSSAVAPSGRSDEGGASTPSSGGGLASGGGGDLVVRGARRGSPWDARSAERLASALRPNQLPRATSDPTPSPGSVQDGGAASSGGACQEERRVQQLPVKAWTTNDLCWWLEHCLELGEAVTVIQSQLQYQAVTGYDLATLTAAELVEMLMRLDVWPHHRHKILKRLKTDLARPAFMRASSFSSLAGAGAGAGMGDPRTPRIPKSRARRALSGVSFASTSEDGGMTPSGSTRPTRSPSPQDVSVDTEGDGPAVGRLELQRASTAPARPDGPGLSYAAAAVLGTAGPLDLMAEVPGDADVDVAGGRIPGIDVPLGYAAQTMSAAARKNLRRRQKRREGSEKRALSYLARSVVGGASAASELDLVPGGVRREVSASADTASTTSADASVYYHGGQYRALPDRTIFVDVDGVPEERIVVCEDVSLRRQVVLKFFRSRHEFVREEEVMQTVGPQVAPEVFSKFVHDIRTGDSTDYCGTGVAAGGAGGAGSPGGLPDSPGRLRRATSQDSAGSSGSSLRHMSSSQRTTMRRASAAVAAPASAGGMAATRLRPAFARRASGAARCACV